MDSLILRVATRLLAALMIMFSVFVLMRGHNEPGGGFIGGLLAATGIALSSLADGPEMVRRVLRIEPRLIAMIGVLVAVASGLISALTGDVFLTGVWGYVLGIPLGTPMMFDTGVYLVVVGGVMAMLLALEEEKGG
ncbi:MnhB domain-containing protein [Novispirillum sp. DQ9]|uniref:MnhB domain-containing protein n=1 Tax=Novispirillum sp. DQ9 TaxID=3398612 RepID=UPI003C7CD478